MPAIHCNNKAPSVRVIYLDGVHTVQNYLCLWVGAYEQAEMFGFWILGVKWGNVRKLPACGDYKRGNGGRSIRSGARARRCCNKLEVRGSASEYCRI